MRYLLRYSEAMATLGVSRTTIYELIALGKLVRVHIGKKCARITGESIEAYVQELKQEAGVDGANHESW